MSFGRIESGGNQVKDSMTQLSEVMQRQELQTKFDQTLNEEQNKKETIDTTKEASSSKSSSSAKSSDKTPSDPSTQEIQSRGQKCEQVSDQQSSQTSSDNSQDGQSAQESADAQNDLNTTDKTASDTAPSLEDSLQINQNDLLLLSLLITPPAQPIQQQSQNVKDKNSDLEASSILESLSSASSQDQDVIAKTPTTQNATSVGSEEIKAPLPLLENKPAESTPKETTFSDTVQSPVLPQVVENQTSKKTQAVDDQNQKTDFFKNIHSSQTKQDIPMKTRPTETIDTAPVASFDSTEEPKTKKLRLDELILELRNPELALAQKSDSVQMSSEIKRMDASSANMTMSTEIIERNRSIQNQVLSAMRTIIDRHEEKMTIHLDPPEWGKIDVQMKLQNKELSLQIKTEHLFVKESLEKGIPVLKQSFSGQGLQLGQLHIGMGQQSQQERPQEDGAEVKKTIQTKNQPTRTRWRDPRSAIVDRVI